MQSKEQKLFTAGTVFTPSAPINKRDLFSGRIDQIEKVIDAITQVGQHAIIYGERGVGKTSLANMIYSFLPSAHGIITVKVNCEVTTTFESLFSAVLSDMSFQQSKPGVGFNAQQSTEVVTLSGIFNQKKTVGPNELRVLFSQLGGSKIIIIIDEFDRIKSAATKQIIADTIKNFSDYGIDVTLVVVGVADSVDSLIAGHESIGRALIQIQMPRMVTSEISDVVDKGLTKLNMTIEPEAKSRIVKLSQGLPHYTHLLSLYAAGAAIKDDRQNITLNDVNNAINAAIEKAQQSIKDSYYRAISSSRGNLYQQVLLACAMTQVDDMGYFVPADTKKPLKLIMKKAYEVSAFARHLNEFCDATRGPALKKVGHPRRYRYRFIDPLLGPFVIMNGLSKGYVTDNDLL